MDDALSLSAEQQRELAAARERARSILKAARTATFNTWTLGGLGGLTVILGLFDLRALVLGLGMLWVAWTEHRGRQLLRRFDPSGPPLLGRNQLVLMGVVVVYAVWGIVQVRTRPDPALAQMDELLGSDLGTLLADLTTWVYVGLIVTTGLFQGLMARYYFARTAMIEAYLRDTPAWVLELQQAVTLG